MISKTDRGCVVETGRYRVEFRDGMVAGLFNKLMQEEYLDKYAPPEKTLPHLPSGLGTQAGEPARSAAENLYKMPWWEHRNDIALPNQHYPDVKSKFNYVEKGGTACRLEYQGLTDGQKRYEDETFVIALEVEAASGDLLVTPEGVSPRPGVYSANLSFAPMASAVTAEAPITDGVRISRQNTGPVMWANLWPTYWNFGFLAFNGWKQGAFGIWAQDKDIKFYKALFYINNEQGVSFSFSMMNIPPFEELKSCVSPLPWRIQAFEKSWYEAAARYREWRDKEVKLAPRPDYAQKVSFMASLPGPGKQWRDNFLKYVQPWQENAVGFLACVRKQQFDHNHADNTPVDIFKEDNAEWVKSGAHTEAYLQPMIMWGPFTPDDKATERERQARALHKEADTHTVFLKNPEDKVPYMDQHHLGHPGWQRWFLDWIKEWCQQNGAQGIYHDQSYPCPIDRRGLAIGGMTTPQGNADYFYKAAMENPGTIHGTEMLTEADIVGCSTAIGSGYHWGTAPYMRMARGENPSAVCSALAYPHAVLWAFVRNRGDLLYDMRERQMLEYRAEIAGAIDGALELDPSVWPMLCNTMWYDRTRDVTFLKYGLRPSFPDEREENAISYFKGSKGEDLRYERTPWGSRFVQVDPTGKRTQISGRIYKTSYAEIAEGGIAGWVVYNDYEPGHTWKRSGPAGLHSERQYVYDPTVKRPAVYFSSNQGCGPSFYEAYAEDGFANEYYAFLKLRVIESLVKISGSERVDIHSPHPPKAVYVNGRKVGVKPETEGSNVYPINVPLPADILVVLKDAPDGIEKLHESAAIRIVEQGCPVDIFRSELISANLDGGVDKDGRKTINAYEGAVGGFVPAKQQLHLLVAAPGDKGGTLRISLDPKLNKVEEVAVNLQPLCKQEGLMKVPETVDIPFAAGETKLISIRTQPSLTAGGFMNKRWFKPVFGWVNCWEHAKRTELWVKSQEQK